MKPLLVTLCALLISPCALAMDGEFWYFQTSAYTKHWKPDPDHNNRQKLIGIERNHEDGSLWGDATFLNSFDQRSYYGYYGHRWVADEYPVYAKLSGGLVYGYKGKYKDRIPLNRYGIAPVLVPAIGTFYGPVGAELVILGGAAAMINVGLRY